MKPTIPCTKQRFIYKYMPISNFTFETLANNQLFFGMPKEFNDLLDCRFIVDLYPSPTMGSVEFFYKELGIPDSEVLLKLESFRSGSSEFSDDINALYNRQLREDFCISCFSESCSSMLMWSHYAANNRGICLRFDWKKDKNYFKGYKVKYSNRQPSVAYDGKGFLDGTEIFLTKLNAWRYEKEVRSVVRIEQGIQSASFNPEALTGVIFGERVSDIDKLAIKKIISDNGNYLNVTYFTASAEVNNKKLNIRKE